MTKNSCQLLHNSIILEESDRTGSGTLQDTSEDMEGHGVVSDVYLGGAQDVEHEGQAHADQLLAVVLLPDGGELSEQ